MSWLRLDDGFTTHPKTLSLTDRGFRVWVGVLTHCARHRTRGAVDRIALRRLGVRPSALTLLLELRLLLPDPDDPDTYWVNDWSEYNGRDENEREAARERKRTQRQRQSVHPRDRHENDQNLNAKQNKTVTQDAPIHAETPEKSRVTSRARLNPYPKELNPLPTEARDAGTPTPGTRLKGHGNGRVEPIEGNITSELERLRERLRQLGGPAPEWPAGQSETASEGDEPPW